MIKIVGVRVCPLTKEYSREQLMGILWWPPAADPFASRVDQRLPGCLEYGVLIFGYNRHPVVHATPIRLAGLIDVFEHPRGLVEY